VSRADASRIAHGDLELLNPLPSERLDEVLDVLALEPGATVLDLGCGKGELLRRVAARYEIDGLGVDISAEYIEQAQRGAPKGLRFEQRDMNDVEGEFHLAISHAAGWGRTDTTLGKLAGLTRPGGQVLLGEGYWRGEPTDEYLAALGAERDELRTYGGTLELAEELGLVPLYAVTASEQDWDRYEWRLILNAERHGGEELLDYARGNRDRYAKHGGREQLGFALWLFARPRLG
jgi:SAM-dependent methyltransferase